jgi:hypothetical protein
MSGRGVAASKEMINTRKDILLQGVPCESRVWRITVAAVTGLGPDIYDLRE